MPHFKSILLTGLLAVFLSTVSISEGQGQGAFVPLGNRTIESFVEAKKHLKKIYAKNQVTFYCKARFDDKGKVEMPEGFKTPKYANRSKRIEWEHIVPAENFGRIFVEWCEGHPSCVDKKGKPYKGRKCAEKVNREFRLLQADMYNLVPAIGAVNALRSNYNFTEFEKGSVENTFGSCPVKISNRKVEPPHYSKGMIARTYFYLETVCPSFKISKQQRRILTMWNELYPVDEWECMRMKEISKIQKSENKIVESQCKIKGLI